MTLQVKFVIQAQLEIDEKRHGLNEVLALLNQIEKHHNLRQAAKACGFSYRKAWDRLKGLEKALSTALVEMQRGKGTRLTAFGHKLLLIERHNHQVLENTLQTAALKASEELQKLLSTRQTIKIIASDSVRLSRLREKDSSVCLSIEGSWQALRAYAEGKCDMAGFHIADCMINQTLIDKYCQLFDPEMDQFILLEQRQQGLISRPEQAINSLRQVADSWLRFVNRQQGSGTRILFDYLLRRQQLSTREINGYYHEQHTHLAVASLILSHQADVGLGVEEVARQLKLHFSPISLESYFLVYKKTLTPTIQSILAILETQGPVAKMDYAAFINVIRKKK